MNTAYITGLVAPRPKFRHSFDLAPGSSSWPVAAQKVRYLSSLTDSKERTNMQISSAVVRTWVMVLSLLPACVGLGQAQSGWTVLSPQPVAGGVSDFSFTDASNGIAVTGALAGGILVTSDGGSNWTTIT